MRTGDAEDGIRLYSGSHQFRARDGEDMETRAWTAVEKPARLRLLRDLSLSRSRSIPPNLRAGRGSVRKLETPIDIPSHATPTPTESIDISRRERRREMIYDYDQPLLNDLSQMNSSLIKQFRIIKRSI